MIPTTDTIQRAAEILRQIDSLQAELAGLFTGGSVVAAPKRRGRPPGSGKAAATPAPQGSAKKRRMSAEGRARIAAAAKARWAKFRAGKGGKTEAAKPAVASGPAKAAGKKVKMSAAGRAAIVAAQKARWARIRAEKKESGKG